MENKTPLMVKIYLCIGVPIMIVFFAPLALFFGIKNYWHFWVDELIKELKN